MWARRIVASLLLRALLLGQTPSCSDGFVTVGSQKSRRTTRRDSAATSRQKNGLGSPAPLPRGTSITTCSATRSAFLSHCLAAAVGSVLVQMPFTRSAWAKGLGEDYRQGTAALADSDETAPVPREAYKKLDSGVVYADLRPGSGEVVRFGSRVNLQWVLRKSNGYFVDSSERNGSVPFIFTVGDKMAIAGLDEAVRGMKEGGVRRILIPPSLAYVDGLEDGKPGPLPNGYGPRQQMRRVQNIRKDVPGEYVFLEVQATRVR